MLIAHVLLGDLDAELQVFPAGKADLPEQVHLEAQHAGHQQVSEQQHHADAGGGKIHQGLQLPGPPMRTAIERCAQRLGLIIRASLRSRLGRDTARH
ncbi:hypothetical protein D3C75_1216750 [compost metagenome]